MADEIRAAARVVTPLSRVLVIHTDGNTFNNPTLKCVVDLLLARGAEIVLRVPRTPAPLPRLPGVTVRPMGRLVGRCKRLVNDRFQSRRLSRAIVRAERALLYEPFDLTVAVDRLGLIDAGHLHALSGTPYVLFSFEIMFEVENPPGYKRLERAAAAGVRRWFIQDSERAALLARENGLRLSDCTLLPLASAGPGRLGASRLRDRLGVPPDRRVAIVTGSLAGWAMTAEIVESVEGWPSDWVLIIHERYGRTRETLRQLGLGPDRIDPGRIYFSEAATDCVDDMGEVLAGVSAGLAFYRPDSGHPYTGRNLESLGLASGKISTYLRYGVPVVMNEIGEYARAARSDGFGLVADRPATIGALLPQLRDPAFGARALRYFERHLDFDLYKEEVWRWLVAAAGRP